MRVVTAASLPPQQPLLVGLRPRHIGTRRWPRPTRAPSVQAIMINGQSGSGKTMVAQSMLDYFAYVSNKRLQINKNALAASGKLGYMPGLETQVTP